MTSRPRRATPAVLAALIVSLAAGRAAAQPLTSAVCPLGTVFQDKPAGYTTFVGGMAGIPLLRRTIDTGLFPEALCNDGSPAVMYIRPADAAYGGNPIMVPSNKWLIFFDGGGGCHDANSCVLGRWCGQGGAIFDRAGKMTSTGLTASVDAIRSPGGIFSLTPPGGITNFFADFNHVLVHYCSSDTWVGSSKMLGLSTTSDGRTAPAGPAISFDIEFRGEAILHAVLDTLSAGSTGADAGPAAAFYATTLPALGAATQIVVAAESAGTGAVRNYIDDIAADFPLSDVRGLIDAGFGPTLSDVTLDWTTDVSPVDYDDHLRRDVDVATRTIRGANDSAHDESCLLAVHEAQHDIDGVHPIVCSDTTYTLLNHITSPMFVRMDIDDFLAKEKYLEWTLFPGGVMDYWTAQHDQLVTFSGYGGGVGGIEGPVVTPGVFGPKCGKHVAIQTDAGFFRDRVVGPTATGLTFHDLLQNWLTAAAPVTDIQADNPGVAGYTQSLCF